MSVPSQDGANHSEVQGQVGARMGKVWAGPDCPTSVKVEAKLGKE